MEDSSVTWVRHAETPAHRPEIAALNSSHHSNARETNMRNWNGWIGVRYLYVSHTNSQNFSSRISHSQSASAGCAQIIDPILRLVGGRNFVSKENLNEQYTREQSSVLENDRGSTAKRAESRCLPFTSSYFIFRFLVLESIPYCPDRIAMGTKPSRFVRLFLISRFYQPVFYALRAFTKPK